MVLKDGLCGDSAAGRFGRDETDQGEVGDGWKARTVPNSTGMAGEQAVEDMARNFDAAQSVSEGQDRK